MRQPQQQNRRGRGRGRKPQNPLQRGYESNGPDVKIRGNASHIAEKYITLARDALSSGDTVMAENYLQHAEHYNRIIASAQQQNDTNGQGANGQSNGRGDGSQRNRRNNNNNNGNAGTSEQPMEASAEATVESAPSPAEPAKEEVAGEEAAPKPRRRRAPRTKMAAPAETGEEKPGPVRMGDMPVDEAAS